MRIIVDFSDPNNDLEVIGLEQGDPADALGPRGKPIWRLFSAAVRTLFLIQQQSPAARDALQRELKFIGERIREVRP